MNESAAALERLVRDEWGQVVAVLARDLGDLDLAEDAVQEAVTAALATWPRTGIPDRPGAWITVTARRKALDRLRRDARFAAKTQLLAQRLATAAPPAATDHLGDEQLDLLFACCHPALAMEARVPLTLRSVAGLSTAEIARALLVPEATVAQRIVRAKRKIRGAGIPLAVPPPDLLPSRLADVLAVVYLVFNEGYSASSGDRLVREELCDEAIRLARLMHRLLPDEAEATGLLALLLLTDARRAARLDAAGDLVLLGDQDRSRWDRDRIEQGATILSTALEQGPPGPYVLQASIAFEHDRAAIAAGTDWRRIAELYELLEGVTGSAVVALNHAVAVAMADGPGAGLARADALADRLDAYPFLHATRADLLRRLDRHDEAAAAYERALVLTATGPERRFLQRRLDEVAARR
jgi:RNA polymerase sigma-70 factor, ECF subfamily